MTRPAGGVATREGEAARSAWEFEDAERLGREAVGLSEQTDFLPGHGRALEDLASVLRLAGRPGDALIELESALHVYEQKGDLTSVARVRALLGEPGPEASDRGSA